MFIGSICQMALPFQKTLTSIFCVCTLCLIVHILSGSAYAEGCHPFQLSLVTPVQLVPKEGAVCGVRLDLLWGENSTVWGLDAGLMNRAGELRGIEAGVIANRLKGLEETPSTQSWGVQMAALVNSNIKAPFAGFQIAGLANDHDEASFTGLQVAGLVNDNDKSSFGGIQVALLSNQNYQSEVTGIQVALFNQAQKLNGFQIGLANGVSAAEGTVGILMIPVCFVDILLTNGGLICNPKPPLYNDAKTRKDSTINGAQVGLITNLTESLNGFQISSFLNLAGRSMNGVQVAAVMNLAGDVQGVQLALLNAARGNMDGLQIGFINNSEKDVQGVQIGIINICKDLKGLQIGAVNVVWGRFPSSVFVMPLINFGF
jgi:hypothetical protein